MSVSLQYHCHLLIIKLSGRRQIIKSSPSSHLSMQSFTQSRNPSALFSLLSRTFCSGEVYIPSLVLHESYISEKSMVCFFDGKMHYKEMIFYNLKRSSVTTILEFPKKFKISECSTFQSALLSSLYSEHFSID